MFRGYDDEDFARKARVLGMLEIPALQRNPNMALAVLTKAKKNIRIAPVGQEAGSAYAVAYSVRLLQRYADLERYAAARVKNE